MGQVSLSTSVQPQNPYVPPAERRGVEQPPAIKQGGTVSLFTGDSFQTETSVGRSAPVLIASEDPSQQNLLQRVGNFFKGFGLGALEAVNALGDTAKKLNDLNPITAATNALAGFLVSPLTGKSPGQVVRDQVHSTQSAGSALLAQTNNLLKLAGDLGPGQIPNFVNMSKAMASDLLALRDSGQLSHGKAMEVIRNRTGQNPSFQAAQALLDSVTNYKAILKSGGSPEEIGRGAFRIFATLAPFAKSKVAGRTLPEGMQALPRPEGVSAIARQPTPVSPSGFRGTLARVPNNAVGQAYMKAYELAKKLVKAQGGEVKGIVGSIAEGRGRLGTFDPKRWTLDQAQTLDKLPIAPGLELPPGVMKKALELPKGSIEAKLAGGKSIPSDLDLIVDGISYAQQKAIKAQVFAETGVLLETVKPATGVPAAATGLSY